MTTNNQVKREKLVEILGNAIRTGLLKSVEWEVIRDSVGIAEPDDRAAQISLIVDAIEWLKQDFFDNIKHNNPGFNRES